MAKKIEDQIAALKDERQNRVVELTQANLEGKDESNVEFRRFALFQAQRHPDVVELDEQIRDLIRQKQESPEYQEDLRRAQELSRQELARREQAEQLRQQLAAIESGEPLDEDEGGITHGNRTI